MKKVIQVVLDAIATFGTMCVGAGIVLLIEHGFNIWTLAFNVAAILVAVAYSFVANSYCEDSVEEEIEE